ncbi:PREDICTED: TNFAIP3-interacting protein 3 isoform X2 [Calidris pugnax]|uniref:TNFAIP3-interacting protein 3 isoform X2 n=1 Tax=Calidris pugnax TaxID=198806 RepID=UPI00071DC4F6|nr:PREDICTED: TNFAIP3-interacting protein 3 isoform X2 [Calidris pugnax]
MKESQFHKGIHCEQLKRKNKDAEDHLELCSRQGVEMERCESEELDVEIRNLIEKNNTYQSHEDPEPIAQESLNNQRTSCSLKSRHILLTEKSTMSASSLEQQILSLERQKRQLLEVNKQWDHQFRRMKQLYEKQLAEMKAKLEMSEKRVGELEEERHRQHPEDERLRAPGRERPLQEAKETKVLSEALQEMKEENKLLKQKNASMIRKKEHYECEINRLNKALLDVLKKQQSPVFGTPSENGDRNSLEDMRTQLEVLKQQVQIYEEDFRKERSDRERLNEEKEALQKINERLQSQLNKLSSQTKDLSVQSERPSYPPPLFLSPCVGSCGLVLHYPDPRLHPAPRRALEQQQRLSNSPDYQWYVPDQFPPDVQHKANDSSSEEGAHR